MSEIRDRISELRRVRAGDLIADERNWRVHTDGQRAALTAMLERVGYAGAALVRDTPEGLKLIDGHLRASINPEQVIPVLVLDVNEDEATQLLATYDPLSAMAETDTAALATLLENLPPIDTIIDGYLADLVDGGAWQFGSEIEEPETVPSNPPPNRVAYRVLIPADKAKEIAPTLIAWAKGHAAWGVEVKESKTASRAAPQEDALPTPEEERVIQELEQLESQEE